MSGDQSATLTAIGERIIPGSAAAQCTQVIDLVLTVEPEDTRRQLLRAIAAFDGAAQNRYGKTFQSLLPAEQDAVVAALADGPNSGKAFNLIKEWLADSYWSSRQGLRELGWNGQQAWPNFDACATRDRA
jgi:hypothetical protein